MKTFTKVTILVFRLFLFSILGYMIVEQVSHYIRNDDVSSMRYNKFASHREDIYPTFSICIASYRGGLFKDALGVNRAEVYVTYLQGKLKDIGLNNDYNISELDYDDSVIDVRKIFQLYHRKSKRLDGKLFTKFTTNFDEVFKVSYQNHEKVCFSKKEIVGEEQLMKVDMIKLSSHWLSTHDSQLGIHIHLKGQFLRTLGKPAVTLIGKDLFEGKGIRDLGFLHSIKAKINSMDILRKRHDANEKCNTSLKNDDEKWLHELINKIECSPPFMGYLAKNSDSQTELPNCDKDQLNILAFNYSAGDNFEAISNSYLPPCTQMSSVVTTTENQKRSPNSNKPSTAISFEYPTEYRETQNQREYGVYDLWSQIGGIMGIIVGYSLMQIPQTIEDTLIWSQDFQNKRSQVSK